MLFTLGAPIISLGYLHCTLSTANFFLLLLPYSVNVHSNTPFIPIVTVNVWAWSPSHLHWCQLRVTPFKSMYNCIREKRISPCVFLLTDSCLYIPEIRNQATGSFVNSLGKLLFGVMLAVMRISDCVCLSPNQPVGLTRPKRKPLKMCLWVSAIIQRTALSRVTWRKARASSKPAMGARRVSGRTDPLHKANTRIANIFK